jgi:hypothetical protein
MVQSLGRYVAGSIEGERTVIYSPWMPSVPSSPRAKARDESSSSRRKAEDVFHLLLALAWGSPRLNKDIRLPARGVPSCSSKT